LASSESLTHRPHFSSRWSKTIEEEFLKLDQCIVALQQYPDAARYNELRKKWEQLAWLSPLVHPKGIPTSIDNNRHWQINEDVVAAEYQEAGALQKIEYQVFKGNLNRAVVFTSLQEFSNFVSQLKNAAAHDHKSGYFEVSEIKDQLTYLLASELYRQFSLQLSGHFRLHQDLAIEDTRAFFNSLRQWGHLLGITKTPGWSKKLYQLQNRLHEADYASLDRMALYVKDLRPLYRLTVANIDVEDCSQRFGLPGNKNGELFDWQWFSTQRPSITEEQVHLGRLLFFDPLLSGNWRRSCASCHQPSKAFADGRATSMAFDFPQRITRNAPSLVNAFIQSDKAGHGLEKLDVEQFLQSVFNHPQELRISSSEIVRRLGLSDGYLNLFERAYPNSGLDSTTVLKALSAYVLTLNDMESVFDTALRSSAKLPEDAIQGFNLFLGRAGCGSCHFPPFFSGRKPPFYRDREIQSLGITNRLQGIRTKDEDTGVGAYRMDARYNYFFQTPSLRNLSKTAPYTHNGSLVTLPEILTYLCEGEYDGLATLPPGSITLDPKERSMIIAFLRELQGDIHERENKNITLPVLDHSDQHANRRPAGLY